MNLRILVIAAVLKRADAIADFMTFGAVVSGKMEISAANYRIHALVILSMRKS